VKKASNQIVSSQDKKKKKPRRKGIDYDDNSTTDGSDFGRRKR